MSSLVRRTARNALWNYTAFAASKLAAFVSTIILARLLVPDDFGLLALGVLALNLLEVLRDLGISQAYIYHQDDVESAADVTFTLSQINGFVLFAVTLAGAPLVASYFREPALTPILRVLSVNFVINSLGNTHLTQLAKNLDFRTRFVPDISRAVAKAIVSVGLALLNFGVWSLVWGQIASSVTATVMAWIVTGWRPRIGLERSLVSSLMKYGLQIVLVGMIAVVYNNADYLFVGRRLGSEQLGYYTMGFRLPELIIINIVIILGQAAFPSYATIQNDLGKMRQGYLTLMRLVSMVVLPVGLGMFFISPEFVRVFYSETWTPSIPVMRLLTLYAVAYALAYNTGDVFKAIGRPGILNQIGVLRLILLVSALWFAVSYGITYVAWGQFLVNVVVSAITLGFLCWHIKLPPRDLLKSIQVPVLATILMILSLYGLGILLVNASDLVRMLSLIACGSLVYGAMIWWLDQETIHLVLHIMRPSQ